MAVAYINSDFHGRGHTHVSPDFDVHEWQRRQAPMGVLLEGVKRHQARPVTLTKAPGHIVHPAGAARSLYGERHAIVAEVGHHLRSQEDHWASQASHRSSGRASNTAANHTPSRVLVNPEFLWDSGISHVALNKMPNLTEMHDPIAAQRRFG